MAFLQTLFMIAFLAGVGLMQILIKSVRDLRPYLWGSLAISCLAACSGKTERDNDADSPKILQVSLQPTSPSYKDLFDRIEVVPLESNPQALIGYLDQTICIGDSILVLDMSRPAVLLFSPKGKFLNSIGERGEGPGEYLMCYNVAYNCSNHYISILEPHGTINEYSPDGRFISKLQLPSKSNYMAFQWLKPEELALWSAVDEDECGVSVVDIKSGKTVFEDWERDRMLDMQRLQPFYQYRDGVKFCPALTNDVYTLADTCLRLDYTWHFSPANIPQEYLNEISAIEKPHEKNQRLILDLKNGVLKNFPSFNGESSVFYYVALQTGIGDEVRYLSVFYDKNQGRSLVFNQFKEGISIHPLFMNEDFLLCQVPYHEVDVYNQQFGLNLIREEDDNPLLAKFYFKK